MTDTKALSETLDTIAEKLEPTMGISETRRRHGEAAKVANGEAVLQVVEREGILHIQDDAISATVQHRRRRGGATKGVDEVKYERRFSRLDRSQIGTWLEKLDKTLTPERGLRQLGDRGLQPLESAPRSGRILLLIHGTFSDSDTLVANFHKNPRGAAFVDWARDHYSHILTFDHPTLSASPMLNARELALLLDSTDAEIDVVCHSRGGLVARWWLEVFDHGRPDKRRAVFVGSPLAGTGLAAPTNIRGSLSLLSNVGNALGAASAALPFLTVLTGLFRVVTSVTSLAAKTPAVDAAIALVPGLSAQSRVGNNLELISLRQGARPGAGRYFAIQSNFESEKLGWQFWRYFRGLGDRAKDNLADLVFKSENDLVVDTGSMVELSDALSIPAELVLDFGTTDEVHHTNYFVQPQTLAFIREMLEYGPPTASALDKTESERPPSPTRDDSTGRGSRPGDYSAPETEDWSSFSAPTFGAEAEGRITVFEDEDMVDIGGVRLRRRGGQPQTDRGEKKARPRRGGEPEQQQQGQQQMAAPPGPNVVRRTPHLDLHPEGAVASNTTIQVHVYADRQAARAEEQSEDIVIEVPPHLPSVDLNAQLLVSPQLEVIGPVVQPMTIEVEQDRSSTASFTVRVRGRDEIISLLRDLPSVGRASISAVFNHKGRPSGSVTRIVPLELDFAVPADLPNVTERVSAGTLRVEANAKAPDLLVQVRAQPINDGRQFQCWVSTPLIATAEEDRWEDWNLPSVAESIVRGYMDNFVDEDASALERLSSLKGAGRQLFDAAPANFKSVYWKLVDAGHPPKNIAVVSDEPCIPWELMIPHRRVKGRGETREPLGVECAVGRWVLGDGCAGPQRVPLSDSIVIAPQYRGNNALPYADDEARFVLKHFPGVRVEPVMLETIDDMLSSRGASILHLSCHGVDPADSPAQAVYLEGNRKLDTTMLSGLDSLRRALEEKPTLVVINACEVGRPKPALVGLGGFAQAFIDLGAAGVVAALWSVRDDLAHDVAMDFYRNVLQEPTRPFAEVLRQVRARAYDKAAGAEDTYAAYCFYGDPLACAAA